MIETVKNVRTMIIPILGIVALAVGNFIGLSQAQIDVLTKDLDTLVTVAASLVGLWGVWKSHEKKVLDKEAVAEEVKKVAVDVVKQVVADIAPEDKPAVEAKQE
jgi:spore maturation protein SpmA